MRTTPQRAGKGGQTQTIVLARNEMTGWRETDQFERRDGNWYPVFEQCSRPVALVWLNCGIEQDVEKAQVFATREGYSVLLFPTDEKDPLASAKLEIAKRGEIAHRIHCGTEADGLAALAELQSAYI